MITAQCTNPNEMKIRVTAEFSIGEWREILRLIESVKPAYYGPLSDFLLAISSAIRDIEETRHVKIDLALPKTAPGDPNCSLPVGAGYCTRPAGHKGPCR